MDLKLPQIEFGVWSRDGSGLELPPGARSGGAQALQPPLFQWGDLVIASRERVDEIDILIHKVATETEFGLEPSSIRSLPGLASVLPFDWAIRQVALLQALVQRLPAEPQVHRRFAERVLHHTTLLEDLPRLEREQFLIFAPQQTFVLMRVILAHADPRPQDVRQDQAGEEIRLRFLQALLAAGTAAHGESNFEAPDAQPDAGDMLAVMLQGAAYQSQSSALSAIARARTLLDAARPDVAGPDSLPLAYWLADECEGVPADTQLAAAFAIAGKLGSFDDDAEAGDPPIQFSTESLRELVGQAGLTGRRADGLIAMLSATRDELLAEFERRGADRTAMVWDRGPVEAKPMLCLGDGTFLLLSPRALISWLSDGLGQRLETIAARRGKRAQFRRLVGRVNEHYAVELCRASIRSTSLAPRVAGDQTYMTTKGERRSPDIAIDCGPDLVLVEVVSGRLHHHSRVSGRRSTIERDLDRLLVEKVDQLHARIKDTILDDERQARRKRCDYFGRPRSSWRYVYPVVVTADDLLESWLLWGHLRAECTAEIDGDRRVQRLTILDMEGLELLMGMAEGGASITDILTSKARSAFAEMELSQWVQRQPGAPEERHPDFVVELWNRVMADTVGRLSLDPLGIHAERFLRGDHVPDLRAAVG